MSKYKFINFEDPFEEMFYVSGDSRNLQKIFQRDKEVHVISAPHNFYVVLCFLGDRYYVTFAVNKDDLETFRQQIDMGVDYKTIMMDLLVKDAYSDITNFKTLKHIQYGFKEYLKEEFYEI